jgi:Cu(I)/Ag(I) efflux system protein CusF
MNHLTKTFLFMPSALMFSAQANEHQHGDMMNAQPAAADQAISATGEVKSIDMESKKITIAHDAIPAVNWPPMTMRFTFTPQRRSTTLKRRQSRLYLRSAGQSPYYRISIAHSNARGDSFLNN